MTRYIGGGFSFGRDSWTTTSGSWVRVRCRSLSDIIPENSNEPRFFKFRVSQWCRTREAPYGTIIYGGTRARLQHRSRARSASARAGARVEPGRKKKR